MNLRIVFLTSLVLAGATPALADDAYTVTPMPAPDTRNKFVAPSGAVFVVNQKSGTLAVCFLDTDKNDNYIVACTPSTKLPQ